MDKIVTKTINRLICFTLVVFSISIIFIVSKYLGIVSLIKICLKAIIPVIIAIFISFLFEPFVGVLIKRGLKRRYSVLFCYCSVLIVFFGLFYFIIPSLIDQIKVLVNNVPTLLDLVIKFINSLGIGVTGSGVLTSINDVVIDVTKGLVKYFNSSISIIFDLLLGISGAIFLSFDFPKFRKWVKRILPNKIKEPIIFYFQNFLPFVHKYFVGILIDSVLIFFFSLIALSLINLDYSLVLSLFIAITNLIPIIGPYIGGIPAVIVGFSTSSSLGISVLIIVLIIQLIESNFLQPYILKNTIKLHPLEGILGISLFGGIFGVIGMVLSPILITSIKLLFIPYENRYKILEEEMLEK